MGNRWFTIIYTATKEITINLVIADYITSAESKTAEVYGNTMDDVYTANKILTIPTRGGRIGNQVTMTHLVCSIQPVGLLEHPR